MSKKEEKQVLSLLRQYAMLSISESEVSKLTRIAPKLSPLDFRQYQLRYKEIQEMYDILRCQPAILKVAEDALLQALDTRRFPFLGDEIEKQKSARGPNWYKERGEVEESRLIMSVIGGISHYEICCLQNLDR